MTTTEQILKSFDEKYSKSAIMEDYGFTMNDIRCDFKDALSAQKQQILDAVEKMPENYTGYIVKDDLIKIITNL